MKYSLTGYLATGRDVGKKSAGISRINRARSWNRDGTDGGVIVGIFPLWHSPSLSFLYTSHPLSLFRSLSFGCFFHIPLLFSPLPLTCLLSGPLQLYRSGRGCSDPRRRSSESWVVATPYLLSSPYPSSPSVPLHLANCLHFSPARDFIRPQRREIKPF